MLIAFAGKAGAGKSYAAHHLVDKHGFIRLRFADPLKSMLHALGLGPDHTDGDGKEKPCELLGGQTPRWAMQALGTEWGRTLIDPDLWVRSWCLRADKLLVKGVSVVVDDCRFLNEAAAIWQRGGKVIEIVNPHSELSNNSDHASERRQFPIDRTIQNNLTPAFLRVVDGLMMGANHA